MEVSLYSAAAAMNATERWQDMVADNLSSASVPARASRKSVFPPCRPAGVRRVRPGRRQFRHALAGSAINFSQGNITPSGNNLDMAIEGQGFFSVKLPNGSTAYTRDGEFRLNTQGQLTTKQGYPVVSDGGSLTFDPNNTAPINVSPDGEVSQGADSKGKISVTEFGNLKALTMGGGGFFQADGAAAQPKPATASHVRQGFVEGSNTSPTLAMASLITSMRMFETNQKVMPMQSDRMTKAIAESERHHLSHLMHSPIDLCYAPYTPPPPGCSPSR